jgi:hypothetical protein
MILLLFSIDTKYTDSSRVLGPLLCSIFKFLFPY